MIQLDTNPLTPEQEDKIMDEYFQSMREYGEKVSRHNSRILKAIKSVRGENFYNELMNEIEESEGIDGFAEIVTASVGKYQEADGQIIKGIWVNQTTNGGHLGDDFAGTVCIEIKKGKYLKFNYSM